MKRTLLDIMIEHLQAMMLADEIVSTPTQKHCCRRARGEERTDAVGPC